jgi:hypothetical protein
VATIVMVTLIIRANSRREKLPVLSELQERLEGLHVLLQIAQEVPAFQKFTAYGRAAELVVKFLRVAPFRPITLTQRPR